MNLKRAVTGCCLAAGAVATPAAFAHVGVAVQFGVPAPVPVVAYAPAARPVYVYTPAYYAPSYSYYPVRSKHKRHHRHVHRHYPHRYYDAYAYYRY